MLLAHPGVEALRFLGPLLAGQEVRGAVPVFLKNIGFSQRCSVSKLTYYLWKKCIIFLY